MFDSVQLLYYKCYKINFERAGSYIYSSDWTKKSNNNPKNKDDKCFQYAATIALNYRGIKSHPERASNIMPFINKRNWDGIKHPSKINDWKTFEKNNPAIALNVLYIRETGIGL